MFSSIKQGLSKGFHFCPSFVIFCSTFLFAQLVTGTIRSSERCLNHCYDFANLISHGECGKYTGWVKKTVDAFGGLWNEKYATDIQS